jgi:hypothetical protein
MNSFYAVMLVIYSPEALQKFSEIPQSEAAVYINALLPIAMNLPALIIGLILLRKSKLSAIEKIIG